MIVNNQEELETAGYTKESVIELAANSGDYYISDVDIDWPLKLIMNEGTTLSHINCKVGGVPQEDFVLYCKPGSSPSMGLLNGYPTEENA